jgi:hypothetical protein
MIFGYHVGARSLVCPLPEPGGAGAPTHFAVTTEALRAMGWKASDREMERSLPRADTPPVFRPSAAEVAAVQKRK